MTTRTTRSARQKRLHSMPLVSAQDVHAAFGVMSLRPFAACHVPARLPDGSNHLGLMACVGSAWCHGVGPCGFSSHDVVLPHATICLCRRSRQTMTCVICARRSASLLAKRTALRRRKEASSRRLPFRLCFAPSPCSVSRTCCSVSRTCCSALAQGSLPGVRTAADLLCKDRLIEGTSKYKYARIGTRTHLCL